MFADGVRRYIERIPHDATGWRAGLRDECVGGALAEMHTDSGQPWSIEELGARAGDIAVGAARAVHAPGRRCADAVSGALADAGGGHAPRGDLRPGAGDRRPPRGRIVGGLEPRNR